MQFSVHLTFDGRCREAMEFYCEVTNGRILSTTTFSETPAGQDVSDDWQRKILHATMSLGDMVVAAADVPPEQYQSSQGFYLFLDIENPDDASRAFARLSEGGDVRMPIQETFWATRFGVVVDRYGIPWEVNCSHAP